MDSSGGRLVCDFTGMPMLFHRHDTPSSLGYVGQDEKERISGQWCLSQGKYMSCLKDEPALAGWDNAENSFDYGFLGSCLKKHSQAPSIVEVLYFRDFPLRPRSIRV